ncbi:hypothetical protein AGLY_010417 [Aphis glycines]|uniref:Major facilitator superfamily (MFS) profile domain-containing protein n=1 Tax=Aphis glycines TaxID=307491 RepID=A0A6G0TEE4_APHGL|nr:hypothetical protein AGLY_010417 [Aphis glycines]
MDLSTYSISIDSSTGISADDELVSEQTASPATGQSPSPNDNSIPCENIHNFPNTATNKSITELLASPATEPPQLPNDDNISCENTNTNKSISELTASTAVESPPSPNDKNTPRKNMYNFPNTSIDKSISKLTEFPVTEPPPSPNEDNTSCDNIYRYSGTATNQPITELSASPEAEPSPSPNDDNISCENMYDCSDTNTEKLIFELTVSVAVESPPSPNDKNTACENMYNFPNTSIDKSISKLTEFPVTKPPPSPNDDNTSCENIHRYSSTATNQPITELPESPAAELPSSTNNDDTTSFVDNMYRYTETFVNKPISELPTIYEDKSVVENESEEDRSTPLQNRDQVSCIIDMHSNPADFTGNPIVNIPSLEAGPPPLDQNENACLYTVLCPSDDGFWPRLTCVLAFLSLFIVDGICSSLFLLDSRVGMAEYLPSGTYALEHLAVIYLFRYLTEPFSCAYINRYGFRYCLFIGSLLSITWIALLYFIENALVYEYLFLAIIGGIGMGMIKTSFYVLLSTLFVVNRHTAHLSLHLGSISGMMFMPPVTEYCLLFADWKTALYIHLWYFLCFTMLMCFTLVFWLFIATPVPVKVEAIDDKVINNPVSPRRLKTVTKIWNVKNFAKKYQPPTLNTEIGYQQFWVGRFLSNVPMFSNTRPSNSVVYNLNWLYDEDRNHMLDVRNLTNLFKNGLIGSRPMYRDDVLFNGNVSFLDPDLKNVRTKRINYSEYVMSMTRICSVADVKEETYNRWCWKPPIAMNRVFRSMLHMPIWLNDEFILTAISEALVHAACFVPFMSIKGPVGQKHSAEAVITLIAGCCGLFAGRGLGYLLHEKSRKPVPLYHVGLTLMANGLSLLMCAMATSDFAKMLPYFGLFGFFFGYYKSIQNVVLYSVFPVRKLNNVYGQISLVRAVSSFAGILIAVVLSYRNENIWIIIRVRGGSRDL